MRNSIKASVANNARQGQVDGSVPDDISEAEDQGIVVVGNPARRTETAAMVGQHGIKVHDDTNVQTVIWIM